MPRGRRQKKNVYNKIENRSKLKFAELYVCLHTSMRENLILLFNNFNLFDSAKIVTK